MPGIQYSMKKMNNNNKAKPARKAGNNQAKRSKTPAFGGPAPLAVGGVRRASQPSINQSGGTKFVVRRREFVGSATNGATTGFALTTVSASTPGYDLSPIEAQAFPWLSQMAPCFERYRFNKIKFDFVPSQSATTAGRYYAAIDYDYDDAVATNKESLMGNMSATEAAVWQPMSLTADPNSLNRDLPYRYVSCTTRNLAVENRTSYCGFLMVAFDTPTANLLVDIWVEYEIEFVTPVYDQAIIQDMPLSVTPTAVAAVSPAWGASFGTPVAPLPTTIPRGIVDLLTTSLLGLALRYTANGGTLLYSHALDLKNAMGKGILELFTRFTVTGVSPTDIYSDSVGGVEFSLFNSDGTHLGLVSAMTSGYLRVLGVDNAAQIETAGQPCVISTTVMLRNLMSQFPSVRYMAPHIFSALALGAGYSGFGFKYSL